MSDSHHPVRPKITDPDLVEAAVTTAPAAVSSLASTTLASVFANVSVVTAVLVVVAILVIIIVVYFYFKKKKSCPDSNKPQPAAAAPQQPDPAEVARVREARRAAQAVKTEEPATEAPVTEAPVAADRLETVEEEPEYETEAPADELQVEDS
jgi:cell division protein FtsN